MPREVLAIVGESGSGKSVSMLAVMGLLPWTATVTADKHGVRRPGPARRMTRAERRKIIGKDIAMIFQEPMASLNPCFTVGFQIEEVLRFHMGMDRAQRRARAIELLTQVGIPEPAERLELLPAPDVGRPVPARHDRHGHRLQPEAADRRRADHRARRHHPEADPRPADAACRPSTAWA